MRRLFTLWVCLALFTSLQGQAGFHGEVEQASDCLDSAQRAFITERINENIAKLNGRNMRAVTDTGTPPVLFIWPLQRAAAFNDYGYYYFSQYVNHGPHPSILRDYNCGKDTYYNSNSNQFHKGTDIGLWPFSWLKMDNSQVEIIAAATGVIVYKSDGKFDRSCGLNSNQWNAVYVQHVDGTVSWYGHMKSGSVTNKNVGDSVMVGEYLGTVGSSGSSTGPHLHFEVHDQAGNLIDPFEGPCNTWTTGSRWLAQKQYHESGINHTATNAHLPVFSACPDQEITNESDYFMPGDTLFVMAYCHGVDSGDQIVHKIYEPDGSLWKTYTFINTVEFWTRATLWYWGLTNAQMPLGKWRYETTFKAYTAEHYFYFGTTGVDGAPNNDVLFSLYPNPIGNLLTIKIPVLNTEPDYALQVFDMQGKLMDERILTEFSNEIPTHLWIPGIYLVKVADKTGSVATMKVLKG